MRFASKLLILTLLIIPACKPTPKQSWQKASDKLREARKLYSSIGESLQKTGDSIADAQKKVTTTLAAYASTSNANQCNEIADKLETFAKFEAPTKEQLDEQMKALNELVTAAENLTSNPNVLGVITPAQREGFITAQTLVKEAKQLATSY
jgi:hypothetical protein